ncbi:unnamed protein product [Cunninghamella blakesleeana]
MYKYKMFQHTLIYIFLIITGLLNATTSFVKAQTPTYVEGGPSNEFKGNNTDQKEAPEPSWIQRNHNYVIIIVIVLVLLGIILYYIVRSVKGMRKRLARENEQQLQMLNQIQNSSTYPSQYQQQPAMMEGYKYEQYPQQQGPPTHNYRY